MMSFVKLQGQEYHFYQTKSVEDRTVVYFKITDVPNDSDEQNRILGALLSDSYITDGDIYIDDEKTGETVCKLEIKPMVGVDYVRTIIQSVGYDIDLSSVSVPSEKPKGIYNVERYSFFDGFDGYKGYDINEDNGLSSEEYYQKNKEEWINDNPEKYQEAKQQNGETVIVKRKDLEFFKEEKRNYILSHPEIFIIED
ncbi:MAG: hypothetical protein C0596_10245 [Marinilabiliales bacterium]|nr:MAG: hypothetical protein C0596_10245 [Marinilabiliales bacterium]